MTELGSALAVAAFPAPTTDLRSTDTLVVLSTVTEVEVLVRYSADRVAAISDAATRHHLTDVGLPEDHRLFKAQPAVKVTATRGGVAAITLGEVDGGTLCVDMATGGLFVVGTHGGQQWHANASVEKFGASLAAFDRLHPFYGHDPDLETVLAAASTFEAAISAIDPDAISTPWSLWQRVSMDISNGDYGERATPGVLVNLAIDPRPVF